MGNSGSYSAPGISKSLGLKFCGNDKLIGEKRCHAAIIANRERNHRWTKRQHKVSHSTPSHVVNSSPCDFEKNRGRNCKTRQGNKQIGPPGGGFVPPARMNAFASPHLLWPIISVMNAFPPNGCHISGVSQGSRDSKLH